MASLITFIAGILVGIGVAVLFILLAPLDPEDVDADDMDDDHPGDEVH